MSGGISTIDTIVRMFEVMGVMLSVALRVLLRKARGKPHDAPELIRAAFERLSGSFVKFGQILSLQIDSLPLEYCNALLALLDRVPPFPKADVERIFREELKSSPEELYAEFDFTPVASASIGQVHRGRRKDGIAVAVKVQRPNVQEVFERDTLLLGIFIKVIFFLRIRQLYFMRDPVRELSTWTVDELDYRREAAYAKLLGDNARGSLTERVPAVYWDLTTTRILTMDFLEGPSVSTYLRMVERNDAAGLASLTANGFVPRIFSSNVISNFLSDAFRHGVFHADLHPANLLILPNNVVGYVDFGIVATLTQEARRKQIELTLAYSSGNPEAIYDGFVNICIISPDADLAGMRKKIEEFCTVWYTEPAIAGRVKFKVTVTRTMMDLLSICQNYGVLIDREMIKYVRSTILADGLVSRLAPGVDLASVLREVVEDYLAGEARKRVMSNGAMLAMVADLTLWMQSGPSGLLHALDLFERRQFRIRAGVTNGSDRESTLRFRAISAAVIWAVVVLFLAFGTGAAFWTPASFPAILASAFLTIWTAWLLRLLQRLAVK